MFDTEAARILPHEIIYGVLHEPISVIAFGIDLGVDHICTHD